MAANLMKAKRMKNDEFYTQIGDIEQEMFRYTNPSSKFGNQFEGKVVFLNCDDPLESHFWKYFYLNFKRIGLKKVMSTHYKKDKPTYKLEYDGKNIVKTNLLQNGDFRSPECINLLKEADIVVTNPPFSLFREYVAQLIEHEKEFLILGSQNAVTYKEIFKLIKDNRIWFGYKVGAFEFEVPEHYNVGNIKVDKDGKKFAKLGNIAWFTNLETTKRTEELFLYKEYDPVNYPKYDNYDAINVDKIADIPKNYYEPMGVPITFLDKYNPDQFEILDCCEPAISVESLKKTDNFKEYKSRQVTINNTLCQKKYHRLLVKRKDN